MEYGRDKIFADNCTSLTSFYGFKVTRYLGPIHSTEVPSHIQKDHQHAKRPSCTPQTRCLIVSITRPAPRH